MSADRGSSRVLAMLCAGIVLSAMPVSAQRAPAFGGAEARLGLVSARDARIGAGFVVEIDAGYVRWPQLRAIAGFSRYVANIDREPGGDEGSYRAQGVWATGRYDLFTGSRIAPYVRAGLTVQSVDADAFDREYGRLLSGTYIGAGAGIGARYALDWFGRFNATAELRRTLAGNITSTTFEMGIRYQVRGMRTYLAAFDPAAPPDRLRDPARPPLPPPPDRPRADTAVIPADEPARRIEAEEERRAREEALARERQRAEEAALLAAERERAAAAEARAAASTAMLRQGLLRAAAGMRHASAPTETPSEFVVMIAGAAFTGRSAALTGSSREELRVLATVLAGYPGHIISVEGHSAGDGAAADRRSAERAAAIRAALIAEGVDPLWISSMGWGALRRAAADAAGAERVEVRVEKAYCATLPVTGPSGRLVCGD